MKKNRWKAGDVYSIKLADGTYGFMLLEYFPMAVFFGYNSNDTNFNINKSLTDVLFQVWIMKDTINSDGFERMGQFVDVKPQNKEVFFYRKDAFLGKYYLVDRDGRDKRELDQNEIDKMEKAQVWSDIHIKERLLHNLNGTKSKWE